MKCMPEMQNRVVKKENRRLLIKSLSQLHNRG